MRAALHLLIVTCLLWCAVGVAEPVQAHPGVGGHATIVSDHAGGDPGAAQDGAAQAHHQHCPVAPDVPVAPPGKQSARYRDPVFAAGIAALKSLARAPPLQPPAAA